MKKTYLCRVGSPPIPQKSEWPSSHGGSVWYPQGRGKPWNNISFKHLGFLVFLDSERHEKVMFCSGVYRDNTNPNPISWGLNGTQQFQRTVQTQKLRSIIKQRLTAQQFTRLLQKSQPHYRQARIQDAGTVVFSDATDVVEIHVHPHKSFLNRFRFIPRYKEGRRLTFFAHVACISDLQLQLFKIWIPGVQPVVVFDQLPVGILETNNNIYCHCGQYGNLIQETNIENFLSAVNEWYKDDFRQKVHQVMSSAQVHTELSSSKKQPRESPRSLQNQKMKGLRQFSVQHFRKLENRIKILQQKIKRFCTPNEPSKFFPVDERGQFIA